METVEAFGPLPGPMSPLVTRPTIAARRRRGTAGLERRDVENPVPEPVRLPSLRPVGFVGPKAPPSLETNAVTRSSPTSATACQVGIGFSQDRLAAFSRSWQSGRSAILTEFDPVVNQWLTRVVVRRLDRAAFGAASAHARVTRRRESV